MSYPVHSGYIWRNDAGWSGMIWCGDMPCDIGLHVCLGAAINFILGEVDA